MPILREHLSDLGKEEQPSGLCGFAEVPPDKQMRMRDELCKHGRWQGLLPRAQMPKSRLSKIWNGAYVTWIAACGAAACGHFCNQQYCPRERQSRQTILCLRLIGVLQYFFVLKSAFDSFDSFFADFWV